MPTPMRGACVRCVPPWRSRPISAGRRTAWRARRCRRVACPVRPRWWTARASMPSALRGIDRTVEPSVIWPAGDLWCQERVAVDRRADATDELLRSRSWARRRGPSGACAAAFALFAPGAAVGLVAEGVRWVLARRPCGRDFRPEPEVNRSAIALRRGVRGHDRDSRGQPRSPVGSPSSSRADTHQRVGRF